MKTRLASMILAFAACASLWILSCGKELSSPKRDNPLDPNNPDTSGDPFHLAATLGQGGVVLTWNRPVGLALDGYRIYRGTPPEPAFSPLSDTNDTSFVDQWVSPGNVYYYKVAALKGGDVSGISHQVACRVPLGPMVIIESGATSAESREVEVTVYAAEAARLWLSNAADSAGTWSAYSTTTSWVLPTGEGEKTVYAKVMYADSSESPLANDTILPGMVGTGTMMLAYGADYTNDLVVDAQLACQGASEAQVSEDPLFTGAPWRGMAASLPCTLHSGDGLKTLFARFRNDFLITSPTVHDDIILDTAARILSFEFEPDTLAWGSDLHLRADCGETGGWTLVWLGGGYSMPLVDNGSGGDATPGDGIYELDWTAPSGLIWSGYPKCRFTDRAGNVDTLVASENLVIGVPAIVVISPMGGSSWQIGAAHAIAWSSVHGSGQVAISISRDGGSTWNVIQEVTEDDGMYDWDVAGPPADTCVIRVADVAYPIAGSSGLFSIVTEPNPWVVVVTPEAGTEWAVNSVAIIQWSSSGASGLIDVDLSRDLGVSWDNIVDDTSDDGAAAWTVTGPASVTCMIRVADSDGTPSDLSGQFSIVQETPASITVTEPAAGADWEVSEQHTIRWASQGTSGVLNALISRDGGVTWNTIVSGTPDDGAHGWTVTGPASTVCRIRVSDLDGSPVGTSGEFAISESQNPWIIVTAPEEGAQWSIGSQHAIEWESAGTSGTVNAALSRDGGSSWSTILANTNDDGQEWWMVTGPASATCIVQLVDADGAPAGASGQFAIADLASMALVDIPGGTFQMGYVDPTGAGYDQAPVHTVAVSPFRMSKYEITQSQYTAFDPDHQSQFYGHPNRPVENVSWLDAARFCNWLSGQDGLALFYDAADLANEAANVRMNWTASGYRLPTEAEWEYACRAGTTTHYYSGDTDTLYDHCTPLDPMLDPIAWYCGNATATHDAGQKVPNAFGLYDIAGNVYEWCNDWYVWNYYEYSPSVNPTGPEDGLQRVTRGGSWYDFAWSCRSAGRAADNPGVEYPDLGFRVVRRAQ